MCESNNQLRKKNKWTSQSIRKTIYYKRKSIQNESTQYPFVKYKKPDIYTKQIKKYGYQHHPYEYDVHVNENQPVLVYSNIFNDPKMYLQAVHEFNDFMDDEESDSWDEQCIYSKTESYISDDSITPKSLCHSTDSIYCSQCECNKNEKCLPCFNCGKGFCNLCSERKLYPWIEESHSYSICENCYIQWEQDSTFAAIQQGLCGIISIEEIINLIYGYCGSVYTLKCVRNCKCKNAIYIKSYYQIINLKRLFSTCSYPFGGIADAYDENYMRIFGSDHSDNNCIALCSDCSNSNKYGCVCPTHGGDYAYILNTISGGSDWFGGGGNCTRLSFNFGDGTAFGQSGCSMCERMYEYCDLLEKCKSCGIEYDDPDFRFIVRVNEDNIRSLCLHCGWIYDAELTDVELVNKNGIMDNEKNINISVQDHTDESDNVLRNEINGVEIDVNHNIKNYNISKWRYRKEKRTKGKHK